MTGVPPGTKSSGDLLGLGGVLTSVADFPAQDLLVFIGVVNLTGVLDRNGPLDLTGVLLN